MPSSQRVSRIRAVALAVLLFGLIGTFLVGSMFPASVTTAIGGVVKITDYTKSPSAGETAFNRLLALLAFGPALVASAVLYGAAEIAASSRRGGRSRSHEKLEVGDEL